MIYLDYAGSTPVLPELLEHYNLISQNFWGNPSATHPIGQLAKAELERCRLKVLETLKLSRDDYKIVFTGNITEANSLALNSFTKDNSKIAYTVLEHDSILNNLKQSESIKIEITKDGFIDLEDLENKLVANNKIELVCVVGINSEIGTIQPLAKTREVVNRININRVKSGRTVVKIFTDLAQAASWTNLSQIVKYLDLFSLSSSKIYAPKGVGCLVYKKTINIKPITMGGKQESGLRAGTENVAGISTFAKALELSQNNLQENIQKTLFLRDKLHNLLHNNIPNILINGYFKETNFTNRSANNINIFIPNLNTEEILTALSLAEVCISSGSNCRSGAIINSPLLNQIRNIQKGANLRITLGIITTNLEIEEFVNILAKVTTKLL